MMKESSCEPLSKGADLRSFQKERPMHSVVVQQQKQSLLFLWRGPLLFFGTLLWLGYPSLVSWIHMFHEAMTVERVVAGVLLGVGVRWMVCDAASRLSSPTTLMRQWVEQQQWVLDDVLLQWVTQGKEALATLTALVTTYAALPLDRDQRVRLIQSCFDSERDQHLLKHIWTQPNGILRMGELLFQDTQSSSSKPLPPPILEQTPRSLVFDSDANEMELQSTHDDEELSNSDSGQTQDTTKPEEMNGSRPPSPIVMFPEMSRRERGLISTAAAGAVSSQRTTTRPRDETTTTTSNNIPRNTTLPPRPTTQNGGARQQQQQHSCNRSPTAASSSAFLSPNDVISSIFKEKLEAWLRQYRNEKELDFITNFLPSERTCAGISAASLLVLLLQLRYSAVARKTMHKVVQGGMTLSLLGLVGSAAGTLTLQQLVRKGILFPTRPSIPRSMGNGVPATTTNMATRLWEWVCRNRQHIKGTMAVMVMFYIRRKFLLSGGSTRNSTRH